MRLHEEAQAQVVRMRFNDWRNRLAGLLGVSPEQKERIQIAEQENSKIGSNG